MLTHAVKGDKGFFMMMLAPSVATPDTVMKKDVTFVVDSSGSMAGKKIEQTRKALEYGVNALHDGDRFNIVRFSTDVEPFQPMSNGANATRSDGSLPGAWHEPSAMNMLQGDDRFGTNAASAQTPSNGVNATRQDGRLTVALTEVNATNRAAALNFIRTIDARGGTAINEALAAAMAMNYDAKRPAIILFLTDGRPTIGETEPERILKNIREANKAHARVFVFGVGEDVNTHLLDMIAGQNGGMPQYVLPDEDIEVKVSSLVDKMSNPVLASVRVEVDKLRTTMIHPTALPDLFSGDQIIVFGRYDGSGDSVIRLTGDVNGKKREFVYEGTFPAEQADNTFIPRLWATRRVGYLLDEIRLRGENAELKDEVIRLSKEHGIMTPYTSYLVLEDDKAYAQHGIDRGQMGAGGEKRGPYSGRAKMGMGGAAMGGFPSTDAPPPAPAADKMDGFLVKAPRRSESAESVVPVFDAEPAKESSANRPAISFNFPELRDSRKVVSGADNADGSKLMRESSGSRAVAMSQVLQEYKSQEQAVDALPTVKHVGKKVFTLLDGRWTDTAFKKDMKTTTVKFGSDEYFKLLADKPALKDYLALGTKVTVVLEDGTALVVE